MPIWVATFSSSELPCLDGARAAAPAPSSPRGLSACCVLFFLYGFEKSERDNISAKELEAFKTVGSVLLGLSSDGLKRAVAHGELKEMDDE